MTPTPLQEKPRLNVSFADALRILKRAAATLLKFNSGASRFVLFRRAEDRHYFGDSEIGRGVGIPDG